MIKQIEIIRKTRSFLLESLKDLTADQFNKIPEGINNNIIWNLGHAVASQQSICYIRAGIRPIVNEYFINAYKSGSKPVRVLNPAEIEEIKSLLFSTLDQLEAGYDDHIFDGYVPWVTRYGVELANIDEAINFLLFHEGLHLGYISVLKKLVTESAIMI